jgi:hypothetical protein
MSNPGSEAAMATMRKNLGILAAIPLGLALAGPVLAHGGGHGGGGHGGGGHGGGGFHGGGGGHIGGFHGGAPAMHGGGFRGGAPAMHGGGFRGGGVAGMHSGYGGAVRSPSMGMPRGMAMPRSYAQPGMARGYGGGGAIRPGGMAGGRAPAMAGRAPMAGGTMAGRGPMAGGAGRGVGGMNGVGGRAATLGSMAGMGHNAYGIGGRAPIGSTGSLAAHNPYSMGGRPGTNGGLGVGGRGPIGGAGGIAATHAGGLGGRAPFGAGGRGPVGGAGGLAGHQAGGLGGRAPIGNVAHHGGPGAAGTGRAGAGINNRTFTPTSMNRAVLSNRSVGINRTSNTINNFGGPRNAFFGGHGFGGQSYAGLHQSWLHGRWGGTGYGGYGHGWGRGGYGQGWGRGGYGQGWGYGRGWGRGYGWGPGFGYGRYGYGGYGLGWGGYGYGLGYGGFGLGLGYGLGVGLGYGLFGLGGLGYGWGGYGLGWGGYGYGLGYGGLGLGLGLGLGFGGYGYGYPYYGGYGYGYPYSGGYGLSSWTYGPSLYDWGYASYDNPYSYGVSAAVVPTSSVVVGSAYDYTQPINTLAAPPDPGVSSQAITSFNAAREAFKAGSYARALELTDQAIVQMPNDAALHEFRALTLFALQRYDESAAALYAVLTAGPGWDWATLSGLYANVSVYTQQLRALEAYCNQNPASAPARFVLAYHYLTAGHTLAALQQLKEVAALQPRDGLAPQLARQLEPPPAVTVSPSAPAGAAPAPTAGLPAPPPPLQEAAAMQPAAATGREGRLEGTWTAHPDKDTTISVTVPDAGHFTWTVTQQGQPRQLQGRLTYGNGILTLAQDQGPAIVGNIAWTDENHFVFKVPGAGPNDPGLTFARQ